jgi:hypothetical protein
MVGVSPDYWTPRRDLIIAPFKDEGNFSIRCSKRKGRLQSLDHLGEVEPPSIRVNKNQ